MAGETSGPGPSEQEIRMVALERKFDELLSFVQLIAKRNTDDENQRKEDDKDTSEAEPEGHSNTNATPPRPPTPPKPEGKDSQLDSKIDSLEEKIRLIQGLNSFGNTDFSSMSWFPNMTVPPKFKAPEFEKYNGRGDPMIHLQMYCRKMAPYADNEPLLIQTFQDTLTGNAAEWYSQLKKISHWKELADTFLAQYGFNSQIAPDRFDLQRMEKKSNETFREFFVDLIPVGERIEDALKTKKIVDMTALMALAEQAAKKAPTKRKEGDVQMIGRNNGRPRQVLPTFTMQPIQPRPTPGPGSDSGSSPGPGTSDAGKAMGHTVENCGQLRHRVQDLIRSRSPEVSKDYLTSPPTLCLNHPEGGVNMVEIEEGNEESIAWRRLFYTLEKQKTHHPNGLVGREEIPSKGSRQPDDPSEFDWYAEINLDDIVEDEMDLDNLQDEEADWGYFMEDDTDEWRDVDFTEFFQFPCLIVPPGFVTPEFEIFYEDGDPEVHLQKYGEKMALHLENELLMISVFPESLSKQSCRLVIVEIKEESDMSSLPALTEERRKKSQVKPPPPSGIIITTTAEEEYAGPMVEGLSIHTITEEEDSTTTPPTRHCQQGEEVKTWTCVPLLQRVSSSNDDILEALERQDEGSKPNIEELEIVNLANEGEEPREVKIGTRCAAEQKEALIALLREFHEIFAWSYQDMPGLDTDIVVHKIPLKPECKPVKASTATDEARSHFEDQGRGGKAIEGRFPKHSNLFGLGSQYSPGAEKGRKSQNQRTSYSHSWTDSQGTIRSRWPKEDKSKTAFVTHWGTFVYDVMPFGLKNAGATYQRAMVTLFHDMIHHEIEVYVDDMIAKSRTAQDHLTDLRKLFQRLKKYQLRLNPNKCAFGVTSGKLLGFIVSGRGIEIDPAKVQAIRSMPAPKTEKEIRSFLGRINYIARFIAQLTATCEPLFKLLRKDVKIKWTEDCQKAFDKIKEYLLNPPILVPPTPGRPLILYLTVQEASMGCMLGQQDETGKKEQAIYYLSKKFTEPETRYLLVEKTCCALAWASKKLRQYMLYYTTWLVSRMDPIKYIFEKPALTGKIARWQITRPEQLELMDSEFPDEDVMTVDEDNQGRWKLYFDGAANAVGSGIGAVLVSPKGQQTPIAVKLGFDCTNNMTEYEACIVGLQAALEFGAYELEVFGDSLLIVSQTNGEWQGLGIPSSSHAEEANRLIQEMHAGLMGAHANGPFLARKIMRAGYYWLTMERDCIRHVQTCHKCQMYQNSKNAPPQYLHTMASPWPFSAWGMDWVEACSFKNVTQVAVTRFVKNNIICRYGMPEMLITDNASNLNNRMMDQLCQQFKIQHHNSAPYRPKMNGAVEAANKNVKKILSKMTETYKDWHEHLPYALCAYRTSVRTSVGATPYSLVYGMEAVLPVEVEIPSLRILSQTQLEEAEWAQATKARPRTFQPGDLVLKKRNMALSDPRGKFAPSYEGPYVVKKAFSGGAIILADMDGEEFRFTH
uniref:Integrase catalytic domain-containing protein n=1 Tax=Fagus sylvatica TaxID=28930 RepID=A0A2N9IU30_FAGSY